MEEKTNNKCEFSIIECLIFLRSKYIFILSVTFIFVLTSLIYSMTLNKSYKMSTNMVYNSDLYLINTNLNGERFSQYFEIRKLVSSPDVMKRLQVLSGEKIDVVIKPSEAGLSFFITANNKDKRKTYTYMTSFIKFFNKAFKDNQSEIINDAILGLTKEIDKEKNTIVKNKLLGYYADLIYKRSVFSNDKFNFFNFKLNNNEPKEVNRSKKISVIMLGFLLGLAFSICILLTRFSFDKDK